MILVWFARRTLRQFVETEEGTMRARFFKLLQASHVGEVLEVADVPVLKFLFCLCHDAMNFVITGAKVRNFLELLTNSPHIFYNIKGKAGKTGAGSRADIFFQNYIVLAVKSAKSASVALFLRKKH